MKFINFFWIVLTMVFGLQGTVLAHHSSGGNFTNIQSGLRYKQATHSIELMYQRRWLDFQAVGKKSLSDYNYPSITQQIQNGQSGNGHQHGVDNSYYQEYRNDIELRANVFWHDKASVAFSIPFRQVVLFRDGKQDNNLAGLGDPVFMLNYFPLDLTGDMQNRKTGHRIALGGGVKLPFGKFSVRSYNDEVIPSYQPGSGSFDFIFQSSYMLTFKKWGWFNYYSYRFNTQNPNGYRFSNTMNYRSTVFMSVKKKRSQIIPHMGIDLLKANADEFNKYKNEKPTKNSGGLLMLGNIGIEYFYKNYGLTLTYGIPIVQKLNGEQFQFKHQLQVGIQFLFNKN